VNANDGAHGVTRPTDKLSVRKHRGADGAAARRPYQLMELRLDYPEG